MSVDIKTGFMPIDKCINQKHNKGYARVYISKPIKSDDIDYICVNYGLSVKPNQKKLWMN